MLNLIKPVAVTEDVLTACNLAEDDYFAWNGAFTYSAGSRAILTSTHMIYEALVAHIGEDPTDEDSDFWVEVGATRPWRLFDGKLADQAENDSGDVTCTLEPEEYVNAVAVLNIDAGSVTVSVLDAGSVEVFNETIELVDTSAILTWWDWFFTERSYANEAVAKDVPGFPGNSINITVSGPSAAAGEIVIGRYAVIGELLEGTEIGITDYSVKERDDFGNALLVERAFADNARYNVSFETRTAATVKRMLGNLRATAAVYFADAEDAAPGTTVFGFFNDLGIPLQTNQSFATVVVEGLV